MGEWIASGRLVDAILAIVVLEAVALLAWRARRGAGPSPGAIVANLAAGASLLVALRLALGGAPWPWIAAALAAAGLAHAWDLAHRLPRRT